VSARNPALLCPCADSPPALLSPCPLQGEKDPEILEAALSTILNIVIDHGPNCRRLLAAGLDTLIELAEAGNATAQLAKKTAVGGDDEFEYGETNGALASDLLQLIGPYNYIVCANCKHRNEGGTTCVMCGHAISFDLGETSQDSADAPDGRVSELVDTT